MKVKLNEVNWFEHVGKPLKTEMFAIPVKAVDNQADCLSHNNALTWENFILDMRNRLSWYIQSIHKEEARKWNEISGKARLDYKNFEPVIIEGSVKNNIDRALLASLKSIMISYGIEQYYFDQLDKNIPRQFNVIMNVYHAGRIPCGWEGQMPKNRGHEAINFSKVKLLIW